MLEFNFNSLINIILVFWLNCKFWAFRLINNQDGINYVRELAEKKRIELEKILKANLADQKSTDAIIAKGLTLWADSTKELDLIALAKAGDFDKLEQIFAERGVVFDFK